MDKITLLKSKQGRFTDFSASDFQLLSKDNYLTYKSVEIEKERLWPKVWLIGPRIELFKKANDFVVEEFAGESLIFIRGQDNVIRGFYNVCPHRGARILWNDKCRGNKTSLVCPYHQWQWDCSGNLENLPSLECFPQLTDTNIREDLRLQEVKVAAWGGWIWYSMDRDIEPLTDYLAPILGIASLYDTDRQAMIDCTTIEVNCNWKVSIENFLESYHVTSIHPQVQDWLDPSFILTRMLGKHTHMIVDNGVSWSSSQKVSGMKTYLALNDVDPDSYVGPLNDTRKALQEAKRKRQNDAVEPYGKLTDRQLTETQELFVFPNTIIGLMAESTLVYRHRPHPTDPGCMYLDVTRMCHFDAEIEEIPEPAFKTYKFKDDPKLMDLFEGPIPAPVIRLQISQDLKAFVHVQQGLRSRAFNRPILGEEENLIKHLHRELSTYIYPSDNSDSQ